MHPAAGSGAARLQTGLCGLQGKGSCSRAAAPMSVCATVSKTPVPVVGPAQLTLGLHLHVRAVSITLGFVLFFSVIKFF